MERHPATLRRVPDHAGTDSIGCMLERSYECIEEAITAALNAVARTAEGKGQFEDLLAVLVDPWRALRHSRVDQDLLRWSVGTGLRWVALRPKEIEWADDLPRLKEFAEREHGLATLAVFIERGDAPDEALILRVQRPRHADLFIRSRIAPCDSGKGFTLAPAQHRPASEVETMAIFENSQAGPPAFESEWPPRHIPRIVSRSVPR